MAKQTRVLRIEEREIFEEHGETLKSVLKVSIYYSLGGVNYFTHQTEPRGYYLAVTPEVHGNRMVCTTMFSGIRALLAEAVRFSQKKLDSFREEDLVDTIAKLKAAVLEKEAADRRRYAQQTG